MSKFKRRILAGAAAFAMLGMQFASVPPGAIPEILSVREMTAYAADPVLTTNAQYAIYLDNNFKYSYEYTNGIWNVTITGYKGTSTDVFIPSGMVNYDAESGTSSGYIITKINDDVFKGNTKITSVTWPQNVTVVPSNMFEGCTSLKTVRFGTTMTMNGEALEIGSGVTQIGGSTFKGCTSLTDPGLSELSSLSR